MKKNIAKICLMMALMVGAAPIFAAASTISSEVEGTSYEKAIVALIEKGVVTGDEDGIFHPEANLTRVQACIIIVKAIDPLSSKVNGTATQSVFKAGFSDLKGYSWASGYIGYAVENGIVKGYPDGTFKPGNKVSTNEMLTMVLRATGYTAEQIGPNWPKDYVTKAVEEGVMTEIKETPEYATKAMAAQMTYNKIEILSKMASVEKENPQGTDKDTPKGVPSIKDMQFIEGSFNSSITTFGGKEISKKIEICTYGLLNEYNKDMTLTQESADYRMDTIYKYKNVKTKAWIKVEDGKIVEMVVPRNVGYSGRAYVVISNTFGMLNGEGEAATGVETFTATKKITWATKKDLAVPTLESGKVYELYLKNGEVQNIEENQASAKGKVMREFTNGWTDVYKYDDRVVTLTGQGGELVTVKSNASIYVWDDSKEEYRSGTLSSLRAGKQVRAYDVSDDSETSADIVIVK